MCASLLFAEPDPIIANLESVDMAHHAYTMPELWFNWYYIKITYCFTRNVIENNDYENRWFMVLWGIVSKVLQYPMVVQNIWNAMVSQT